MSHDAHTIEHNLAQQRFEYHSQGKTAYISYQQPNPNTLLFDHTIVPEVMSGQGVGSALVKHALDYAKQQRQCVIAQCSFVDAYIKRHPEYQTLLASN